MTKFHYRDITAAVRLLFNKELKRLNKNMMKVSKTVKQIQMNRKKIKQKSFQFSCK